MKKNAFSHEGRSQKHCEAKPILSGFDPGGEVLFNDVVYDVEGFVNIELEFWKMMIYKISDGADSGQEWKIGSLKGC